MIFAPDFTPRQMLLMGVFGGAYFGAEPPDDLPASWFRGVVTRDEPLAELNYFGVLAGKSRQWWEDRALMREQDPLGWFQWYCRWTKGRRSPDDDRQIGRWSRFRARHLGGLAHYGSDSPQLRRRQALLQWAVRA